MKVSRITGNYYRVTHLANEERSAAQSMRRVSLCGRDVRPEQIADDAECASCRMVIWRRTAGRPWASGVKV